MTEEKNNKQNQEQEEQEEVVEVHPNQEVLDMFVEKVNHFQGDEVVAEAKLNFDKPMIILESSNWSLKLAKFLHDDSDLQFDFLSCITGVDYDEHMEVVYNFYSTKLDQYLYVKVKTPREKPSVVSVESVWKTADYLERETYDLLGIDFPGHWNLKRILLEDDWEGHPLRKDYVTDKKALGLD
ncbi:NADH-quinone oxidoreductase subunit C [Bacillus shivajii]|uniref:NADH-quinone oxidoreductase subunit C n=1 Tax=Bacillus shivajii TaxID=1983719 RepID=UPI001CFB8E56|nr:NADH-quinone oxidoreductase subunit C [Bacillus shivajii]UCZ53015.1 NADH-quinone oxidoreductase subunit C [Bacillus shivajii]